MFRLMFFRLLNRWGGGVEPPVTPGTVAGRWIAQRADSDSLDAGTLYKTNPDRRWFVFDFGNLPEVIGGQTLSLPTVSTPVSPLGLTPPVVAGPTAGTWVSDGTIEEEYDVTLTVHLSGGGIVQRSGTMKVI